MTDLRGLPQKYAPHLARARARLTVSDEVGLALRAHRRALGLSQRSYAASRGLSRAMLARLEAGAGRMSLETVVDALQGTGFVLRVGFDPLPPQPSGAAAEGAVGQVGEADELPFAPVDTVPPEAWQPTDLVARVRGGSRRFPAHRKVHAVVNPPTWWWMHEFFNGPTEEPQWYAPVFQYRKFTSWRTAIEEQSDAEGAA